MVYRMISVLNSGVLLQYTIPADSFPPISAFLTFLFSFVVKSSEYSFRWLVGVSQCSQRGSPSVLSQDEDGRQFVVPSGHFLKLPDK